MINKGKSNYLIRASFFFVIILLGASNMLTAQFSVYGIAKSNKTKKHGKVISYEPLKTVVMDCQGDTLTFDLNEYNFRFTTRKPPKAYFFPDGVGYNRIALGVLAGPSSDGGYVNYTYHYQKNRFVGYGGGIAYENYGDREGYDFIVPSAVFYSYLSKSNASPFVRLTAGYGIAIKNPAKNQTSASGGFNLGTAVGLRLSTNRIMIDFTAGVRFQKAFYNFDFGDYTRTTDARFQRIDFSVGFMW